MGATADSTACDERDHCKACDQFLHSIFLANGTVHRAAANDIDFRIRAARGSVCNGLLYAQRMVT